MIDNLTEAISHAREVAKANRDKAEGYSRGEDYEQIKAKECVACAEDHERLATWLEELAERREADKWISVKDKLPEEYGNYLVFTDDGDIDIGTYQPRYIVGTWSMCDANGFYWADDKDINVIAWKPLPKAYEPKGGTE